MTGSVLPAPWQRYDLQAEPHGFALNLRQIVFSTFDSMPKQNGSTFLFARLVGIRMIETSAEDVFAQIYSLSFVASVTICKV